jgi:haloalkane dehalogenase
MTVLRTPDDRFKNLPGYDFAPHYVKVNGLRMHYVDEGQGDEVILCLHGEPTWAYLYRKIIPGLAEHYRVVAPDLIGFGRSDKYAELEAYTYHMHHDMLVGFIEALDLTNITLICQDWGGVLGLPIAAELSERFARLVVLNTFLPTGERPAGEAFLQWRAFTQKVGTKMRIGDLMKSSVTSYELPAEIIAAYDAPFPDDSYKAGAATFPLIAPISTDDPGAAEIKAARDTLAQWDKPALVMFSDNDPILGGAVGFFRKLLPTAKDQPEITIEGAGHFLQEEKGETIAQHVHEFIQRSS